MNPFIQHHGRCKYTQIFLIKKISEFVYFLLSLLETKQSQIMSDKKEAVKPAVKKEQQVVKAPVIPVYDPSKRYVWDKDAKFELTGEQFGMWLNSVRSKVSSREAGEYQMAFKASEAIEGIMANGVRAGVIVEDVQLPEAQGPKIVK